MSDNKKGQENFEVAAATDIWMDFTPPAGITGTMKYRKLTDQNILEIYVNGRNTNTSSIYFGVLAAKYRPSVYSNILGMATYKKDGVNTTRVQFLNIDTDGEVTIPGTSSEVITNFIFYGMIDL